MASRNGRARHATLYDFRDLDLMLKVEQIANDEGWTDTETMARSLGFEDAISVASRLNWMRRYGMLEFDGQRRLWRLTPGGLRVIQSKLKAAEARTIEALDDAAMIDVMANVTTRYRLGDPMMAHLIRREFLFGTAPGSRRR